MSASHRNKAVVGGCVYEMSYFDTSGTNNVLTTVAPDQKMLKWVILESHYKQPTWTSELSDVYLSLFWKSPLSYCIQLYFVRYHLPDVDVSVSIWIQTLL